MKTLKKYWKLIIIIGMFALALFIAITFLSIQLSRSSKKNEEVQIELIKKQSELDIFIEQTKQKEFERSMKQSDIRIEEQLKKHEELKELIKNPGIDFSNDSIQNWINSEYNRRFP